MVLAVFSGGALAQGEPVENMSVDEVMASVREWKPAILIGATGLVVAFLLAGGMLSPGGLTKGGRDLKPVPWTIFLFAGLIAAMAQASSGEILSRMEWFQTAELTEDQRDIASRLGGYALGALAGVGMLFVLGKSAPNAGLKLSPLDGAVGLGVFALAFPVVALARLGGEHLYRQMAGAEPPAATPNPLVERFAASPTEPWTIALAAGYVLGKPFVDEMVFRVFAQSGISKMWGSPWLAIIGTSVAYAALQRTLWPGDIKPGWHEMLPVVAMGVCCGVAYERTKRVGVPIAVHAGFNAVALIVALRAVG